MSLPPTDLSDNAACRSASEIKSYLLTELSKSLDVSPSHIDPTAELQTLGVDSLMALGVAGGLAAWLDRDIPATLMWDYRSIDAIAQSLAGVEKKEIPSLPTGIVCLQSEGEQAPIFGFPGFAGTPLPFKALAAELGPTQPFFGVAVPGFDGTSEPLTDVEEIAAAILKTIRKVRPSGPYLLAGYCFGGMLAFEAAQQLVAAGETVSMLAIYDAFTPAGRVARPRWQRLFVHLYLLASGKSRLRDLIGKLKLSHLQNKLNNPKPQYWVEPKPAKNDPGRNVWNVNSIAAAKYRPLPYSGAVLWFGASDRAIYNHFYKLKSCGGWSDLALGGVTALTIAGNHGDLIGEHNAPSAAKALFPHLPI